MPKGCRIWRYLSIEVKTRPVRTISREVFVTPQRLHAGHPSGMMIQSELTGDCEPSNRRTVGSVYKMVRSRTIEEYKQGLALTERQREVLVGILLGDGCLETANGGRTYRLKVEQSHSHQAYVAHLYELFKEWVLTPPRQREVVSRGHASENWLFQTVSHGAFRFYAQQFYAEGRKQAPKLISHWLTPAVWLTGLWTTALSNRKSRRA